MLPDLGKYAGAVLSAYGASLFLLIALVGLSLRRGRAARATLDAAEAEVQKNG